MDKRDIPPGFTYARPSKRNPLPIVLFILLVSPYIKRHKANIVLEDSAIDTFDDSDTVLDILSSIYPYLDLEYQDGINFIFGLAEVRSILNSLLKGTYYKYSKLDTSIQPASYQEKVIGIIRSLQPYISLENQALINRILDTFSSTKELVYRLNKFKHQSLEVQTSSKNNLQKVSELIDIIKMLIPGEQQQYFNQISNILRMVETVELAIKMLIPGEQQQYFNQISNILRMVETVELAQLLNAPEKDTLPTTSENKIASNTEEAAKEKDSGDNKEISIPSNSNIEAGKKSINLEAISHSLKSMLKPEQANSLDLIMKMAQLLAQDNTENAEKESAD